MLHSDNAACKIADKLRELLASAEYISRSEFISSRAAAKLYNVSHVTACRAMHILEQEGVIRCKKGAVPQITYRRRQPRIACFMTSDFSHIPPENCSAAPRRFQLLMEGLKKRNAEYKLYSFYDLAQEHFSKRLLDNVDGLLVEAGFSNLHARALAAEFPKPKVWIWSNEPLLENGNQVLPDFLPGMTEIFKKARFHGIKKCILHYNRSFFKQIMLTAARLSDWQENEYALVEHGFPHSQLNAYRYAMNIEVVPEELHICEVDLTAFGFYQAFTDRGYKVGDFNITGIGNLEGRGHLPLGEPCITTLGSNMEYFAERILEVLFDDIAAGKPQSRIERIASELIIRKSAFYKK